MAAAMIVLGQEHDDDAVRVAIKRRAFALREDKPQYRPPDAKSEMYWLFLEMIGARAELAAHILFGEPWTAPYSETYVSDGDMFGFVETKGVARPDDRIFIKKEKLNVEHAYLLMDGSVHPGWFAVGWIPGSEVRPDWLHSHQGQPPNYRVPRSIPPMRPVKELFALVKERRNAG